MPQLRLPASRASRFAPALLLIAVGAGAGAVARAQPTDSTAAANAASTAASAVTDFGDMDPSHLKIVPCSEEQHTCAGVSRGIAEGLRFTVDGLLGVAHDAVPLHGIEGGFGLAMHKMLDDSDSLGFGGRFQLLSSAGESVDLNGDGKGDQSTPGRTALAFTGNARFAWWLDPVDGNAWVGELGLGYMLVLHNQATSGAFVEATLGFQTSWITHLGLLHDVAWPKPTFVGMRAEGMLGLRLQQGIGDMSEYRALLATLSYGGGQFSTPPRRGLFGPRAQPFDYAFGVSLSLLGFNVARDRFGFGLLPQFGFTFALPLAGPLTFRTMADFGYVALVGRSFDFAYAGLAGVRLNRIGPVPVYLEALAGYAFAFGPRPLDLGSGPIVDAALGLRPTSCSIAGGPGVRGRFGVGSDNWDLRMLMLTWFWEYDSIADRATRCPEPPLSVVEVPPPGTGETAATVVPPPAPTVVVPLPPPPPVVVVPEIIVVPIPVDVNQLLGRRVPFAPDLPFDRLRGARQVRVEIVAPPSTFDLIETGLRVTLRAHGVEPAEVIRRASPYGTVSLGFWILR